MIFDVSIEQRISFISIRKDKKFGRAILSSENDEVISLDPVDLRWGKWDSIQITKRRILTKSAVVICLQENKNRQNLAFLCPPLNSNEVHLRKQYSLGPLNQKKIYINCDIKSALPSIWAFLMVRVQRYSTRHYVYREARTSVCRWPNDMSPNREYADIRVSICGRVAQRSQAVNRHCMWATRHIRNCGARFSADKIVHIATWCCCCWCRRPRATAWEQQLMSQKHNSIR